MHHSQAYKLNTPIMNPQNPNASTRTRVILEDLEAVRENLLELSEEQHGSGFTSWYALT